jgi:hypothetical protein
MFGASELLQEGERDPEMRAYLLKLAIDWTSAAEEEFSQEEQG